MSATVEDRGRLVALISQEAGYDIPGLFREYEQIPQKIYDLRQKIAPLKAELEMLRGRYEGKGQQASPYDDERKSLLSELKEEERDRWESEGHTYVNGKGEEIPKELSDGRAEDKARASKRYRDFIRDAAEDRKNIARIGKKTGEYYDKIEAWKGRQEFLSKLLEQCKAVTYAFGSEARLTPR